MSTMTLTAAEAGSPSRVEQVLVEELRRRPTLAEDLPWLLPEDLMDRRSKQLLEQLRTAHAGGRPGGVDERAGARGPQESSLGDSAQLSARQVHTYAQLLVEHSVRRDLVEADLLPAALTAPRPLHELAAAGEELRREAAPEVDQVRTGQRLSGGEEREVLAAALTSTVLRERLVADFDPEDFTDPEAARAWTAIEELHRQGRYVDAVTVDAYVHRQTMATFTDSEPAAPVVDVESIGTALESGRAALDEVLPHHQARSVEASAALTEQSSSPQQQLEHTRQRLREEGVEVRRLQGELSDRSTAVGQSAVDGPSVRDQQHLQQGSLAAQQDRPRSVR